MVTLYKSSQDSFMDGDRQSAGRQASPSSLLSPPSSSSSAHPFPAKHPRKSSPPGPPPADSVATTSTRKKLPCPPAPPTPQPQMEESVGSNSPPPSPLRRRRLPNASQLLNDRISRAFHHHLRLLHRSDAAFFVLGTTGNVYTVSLSAAPPSCTCPDRAVTACKHTLFVLLRVLGLPLDAGCLRCRVPLRPLQLRRLLDAPTPPETLATSRAREMFHHLFSPEPGGAAPHGEGKEKPEGACPVCLEDMNGREGGLVTCGACGNSVHEDCFRKWQRSRGGRGASCVMCRARWRQRREQASYVNLAAYASEDDAATAARSAAGGGGSCAG